MGCAESTPVIQPQPQPIIYAYAVPPPIAPTNQQNNYKYSEDPVDINRPPPPYNPNLKPTNNAYVLPQYQQYQQTYVQPYPQYYPQYPQQYRQQPSMLQTMGAVAGGVIIGDMVSDALFD